MTDQAARQFDVFQPTDGPPVIVIQSDLLDAVNTRVIVPLLPPGDLDPPLRFLNPSVSVNGMTLVLTVQFIATLPIPQLGRHITSLSSERDRITRAVNALLSGV